MWQSHSEIITFFVAVIIVLYLFIYLFVLFTVIKMLFWRY
jgi:hypothetical protein